MRVVSNGAGARAREQSLTLNTFKSLQPDQNFRSLPLAELLYPSCILSSFFQLYASSSYYYYFVKTKAWFLYYSDDKSSLMFDTITCSLYVHNIICSFLCVYFVNSVTIILKYLFLLMKISNVNKIINFSQHSIIKIEI